MDLFINNIYECYYFGRKIKEKETIGSWLIDSRHQPEM